MGKEYPPAAVPLDSEIVHDLCRIFQFCALLILYPCAGYDFSAGETTNRDHKGSPVGLLSPRSGTATTKLLGLLGSRIADQ